MAIYNVYENKNYRWIVQGNTISTLSEIPYIYLKEYRQSLSEIIQSIKSTITQFTDILTSPYDAVNSVIKNINTNSFDGEAFAKNTKHNPYKSLYTAVPTDNEYRFPYLSEYHHSIDNSWGFRTGKLESIRSEISNYLAYVAPAGGIDTAKLWENISEGSFNISFELINTDTGSDEKGLYKIIQNHKKLIDTLIFANLPIRLTTLIQYPPCIYEIAIPGVRMCPAAAITKLDIYNKGNLNKIENFGLVPDAWEISLTITELLKESNLTYYASKMMGGDANTNSFDKVKAISKMAFKKEKEENVGEELRSLSEQEK